jgi:PHP family Zn ribbon phosphoesterase
MEYETSICSKCGARYTGQKGRVWKKCTHCGGTDIRPQVLVRRKTPKMENVRDNRFITKRPEYVKLLTITRLLDKTIREDKYNSGELARLKNAFYDISLVKELMM